MKIREATPSDNEALQDLQNAHKVLILLLLQSIHPTSSQELKHMRNIRCMSHMTGIKF